MRQTLRLAVPDGHAQRHTAAALADAGIVLDGYEAERAVRRLSGGRDDVALM